jgi:hypothetical protein
VYNVVVIVILLFELAPVAAGAGSFFMLVFYAGNVGAFLSRPLVRG